MPLQVRHLAAHRGERSAQAPRRRREAALLDDGEQHRHGVEAVHRAFQNLRGSIPKSAGYCVGEGGSSFRVTPGRRGRRGSAAPVPDTRSSSHDPLPLPPGLRPRPARRRARHRRPAARARRDGRRVISSAVTPLAQIKVGRFTVTALSDGYADMPYGFFPGRTAEQVEAAAKAQFAAGPRACASCSTSTSSRTVERAS